MQEEALQRIRLCVSAKTQIFLLEAFEFHGSVFPKLYTISFDMEDMNGLMWIGATRLLLLQLELFIFPS